MRQPHPTKDGLPAGDVVLSGGRRLRAGDREDAESAQSVGRPPAGTCGATSIRYRIDNGYVAPIKKEPQSDFCRMHMPFRGHNLLDESI